MLLPINMVAINFDGRLVMRPSTFANMLFCFFSISIWILFEETYAISIPEKKAESSSMENITMMLGSIIVVTKFR